MSFTQTKTFSINQSPVSLEVGDVLKFKFVLKGSTNSNFTASLSEGSLDIYSLAPSLGYATTNCFYFHSSSMSASIANGTTNVITFSPGLSSFYNSNYQFAPNPLTGSVNSLYPVYGDVDYAFSFRPYDIIVTYLSDNTYVESRILETTVSGSLVNIRLNTEMSNLFKNSIKCGVVPSPAPSIPISELAITVTLAQGYWLDKNNAVIQPAVPDPTTVNL